MERFADSELTLGVRQSVVPSASAEVCALESLGDDAVKAALQALPETQRMVIYYIDVEGYRYSEVARILDIPVGTVMSRVNRGRRKLRALLVEKAAAEGYLELVSSADREAA
jgi:RNA polymerase sigma-70 factor (ECF subfamily)